MHESTTASLQTWNSGVQKFAETGTDAMFCSDAGLCRATTFLVLRILGMKFLHGRARLTSRTPDFFFVSRSLQYRVRTTGKFSVIRWSSWNMITMLTSNSEEEKKQTQHQWKWSDHNYSLSEKQFFCYKQKYSFVTLTVHKETLVPRVSLSRAVLTKSCTSFPLTNFKIACRKGWTREQPREDHVDRDCQTTGHVPFTDLNVLYLCRWKGQKPIYYFLFTNSTRCTSQDSFKADVNQEFRPGRVSSLSAAKHQMITPDD